MKTSYEYDNINRVKSVETPLDETLVNTFDYTYDENGNVLTETRNGNTTSYVYDSLNRLVSVTYSDNSSVSYEYDGFGNRVREVYSNGDIKEYIYNSKYQLTEIKLNNSTTDTYAYNASGALISHNNKTYTYDNFDKLTGYSDGTYTHTYSYNTDGIRTAKDSKQYVVDINNNVIAEADAEGVISDEIIWGNQPLARKSGDNWYYYIYNAHGDVVGMADATGNIVNSYEYDPWGNILSQTETVDNPIKYAGEYYDDELGMYYLRARYYDPQIGRFTSRDILEGSIASPLDMNRYVYCRNNPIKYVDPSGMYYLEKDSDGHVYAIIEQGDTLTGIALSEVGNADAWTMMNYSGDPSKIQIGQKINISGIYNEAYPIENVLLVKQKPNFTPNPNKRHGSEKRQPSGSRERNVGHPDGEEHSRVPKGNNGIRRSETLNPSESAEGIAITTGGAIAIYWWISFVTRIIPIRNLIPIP